ncbi:MAG: type II secretion system ATPase GspE [Spirochaetes bacterium]|nr:type II secretion system ATPase GspE [Spirochaetota bacterium]
MLKNVKQKHLGTILIENNVISPEQLQESLAAQKGSSMRLGQILIKKGFATEEDILGALGQHYNIRSKEHIEYSDPDNLLKHVPVHFLKRNMMAPFSIEGNTIHIAIMDPLNIQPMDDLKMLFPEYDLVPVLTREIEIHKIIQTHYADLGAESTADVIEDLEDADLELISSADLETEDLMDMANEAPIIRLVNTFFKEAVNNRASDIHIEPFEKDLNVRYRVDGILYNMHTPPKKFQNAIISRIKIMSNLNIAENRLPQDGRIQIKIGGKDIDIRVSTYPTQFGERIVLRLLNKSDMKYDLQSIGFEKHILESFEAQIQKTHGIILVTGPTGSGKTTTLYSVLTKLNTADVNILTVEDPIEYQIRGIGQMQVKPSINLTFATGLRSILRQDPDIIMIGEIRDIETAEIAVQSALTGHRVFSTLHTNDAPSGITRLLDMGVEPFLISSSVNAILAQRLVRTICPKCKYSYKPSASLIRELALPPSKMKNLKLYAGKGCSHCLNTGYRGRVGIYELLVVSQAIRKMIMGSTDSETIKEVAIREGMITLRNDGLTKAAAGLTTIEEVLRVS